MDLKRQTIADLRDDLEEIKYLFNDYKIKLEVSGIKSEFNLKNYLSDIKSILINEKSIEKLRHIKYKYYEAVRRIAILSSSVITASDWQSPSYDHSLYANAGRQTGKIRGTINDYKRDVHLDESRFENLFLKEYIDAKFKFLLKAYLVNSGQAAFQTILTFLQASQKLKGKVMVGQASYFQYKQILNGILAENTVFFNEKNQSEIEKKIISSKPKAIFIDALCNDKNLALPEIAKIIDFIYKFVDWEIYLVIDKTCLATFSQPFRTFRMIPFNKNVHIICFESLNKYYQFGLDRVTAGIIVCENRDAGGIFEYRKHSGTNITDISTFALPTPNRKLLIKRLLRHKRNIFMLASYLTDDIKSRSSKIEEIVYPFNNEIDFCGSFFNIILRNKYDKPQLMQKFIKIAINEAKKVKINLVAGTSFGLNTTRIYLTSLYSKFGNPFLRISVGTEDMEEMDAIKRVFRQTIRKF